MKSFDVGSVEHPRALSGVRVLDFTWVRAGPWASRWLGAMGAQVIKVEWPQSLDPLRRGMNDTPPEVVPDLNTSGNFNDTNANKLSITLNVRTPKGLDLIKQLICKSDIVLENFSPRALRGWGLSYEEMCKLKPDIVYISQSGFGHTGRHSNFTTTGPIAQAFSGMTHLSGLPDQQPAGWGWSYLDDTGGMYIAFSAMAALYSRDVTGNGQHVDLSQMMIGTTLNGSSMLDVTINNRSTRREGYPPGNRTNWPGTPLISNYRGPTVAPHNAYRTKGNGYNDWCVIVCNSDHEWLNLVSVMGSPTWATDRKFAGLSGRLAFQAELDLLIESWTMSFDKYELMSLCQAGSVRAMPVQSNQDRVENDPQIRHRGLFMEMDHPVLGTRKFQAAPFKLSESPALNHCSAPLIGKDNRRIFQGLLGITSEEFLEGYVDGTFWPQDLDRYPYMEELIADASSDPHYNEPDLPQRLISKQSSNNDNHVGDSTGALSGLRVLELADEKGQWCGKILADLGADVIKVELPGGGSSRMVGPFLQDVPHPEKSLSFWHYNTSKRGITLDVETESGKQLFLQMVQNADIVLETFKPGYMASIGLSYDDLKSVNDGIIFCSITPFGQTGPWKDYLSSDLLHLAAGGQMACCGYDMDDVQDAPPIAPGGGQAWHIASHYACMAIMAAICYRSVGGVGQFVDVSVHDACSVTTEMHNMVWVYTSRVPMRQTGRHASPNPTSKNQLPSKDPSKLVNANVAGFRLTAKQMGVLAKWMDSYGLAEDLTDPKYQDQDIIQANAEHINIVAMKFFANLSQEEIAHGGQDLGFNWGAIRSPDDLIDDGHINDRNFWVYVDHPEQDRAFKYPGSAGIWNGTPWRIYRRAPLIGEHNEEILCGELGLTKTQLLALSEARVI